MKKIVGIILWIVFLLSFIPYMLLIKAATIGADVGLFSPAWEYGFGAVTTLIFFYSLVPIYPICLLYEVIYGIVTFRKSSELRRRIMIFLPVGILLLILVPCIFHEIDDRYKDKKYYSQEEKIVRDYLEEHFSDEILANGDLSLYSRQEGIFRFRVEKEIFGTIRFIEITVDENGTIRDNFCKSLSKADLADFRESFGSYLDTYYGMSDNIDLQAVINDIDMSDYRYAGDLKDVFEKCDFVINSVFITEQPFEMDETIEIIRDFYKYTMPRIPVPDPKDFNFYVMQDDRFHAAIHAFDKNLNDKEVTLFFSGYHYTNEAEPTIADVQMDITLE